MCFSVAGAIYDREVSLPDDTPAEQLVSKLRSAVHPDKVGDPSDNMKGQSSKDCVIVNFIRLG